MQDKIKIIGALPYETVRHDCHKIKEGNEAVINQYAWKIIEQNENVFKANDALVFLIPVPGHNGFARQTKSLAEALSLAMHVKGILVAVLDCLACTPHECLYDKKKRGEDISSIDLEVRFKGKKEETIFRTIQNASYVSSRMYLVDNVVDTGHTVRECFKLTGEIPVIAVGDSGLWEKKHIQEG